MINCAILVNRLSHPVLVLDGSFRFLMANPAFFDLFLIPRCSHVGAAFSDLKFQEPCQVELLAALEAALENSDPNEIVEFTCIVLPGMYKCISVRACRSVFDEHAPEVIIAEFEDTTRRKGDALRIQELNQTVISHAEELRKSNENLELFAHAVSHDLRAPLRLMNILAHEVQSESRNELSESAFDKLTKLVDATQELGSLVQDFLDLSQSKRARLRKKKVNLHALAKATLEIFKEEQNERNVEVRLENLKPCAGDQNLIKQVYTNLLTNAFKFTRTREKAQIQIGCENDEGTTVYFVRDNGIGLGTSAPDTIFQPFKRLANARAFEGSGIGLALVKRIVEYHGGRIWAQSGEEGGTTIYFTLGEPGTNGRSAISPDGVEEFQGQSGQSVLVMDK